MDNRENIVDLFEIYCGLLNEKEKSYFEYYYYEDYSMQEIADLFSVSRAYASKYLNKIVNKLYKFEDALKVNYKNNKIRLIISNEKNNALKNKIEEIL